MYGVFSTQSVLLDSSNEIMLCYCSVSAFSTVPVSARWVTFFVIVGMLLLVGCSRVVENRRGDEDSAESRNSLVV